jgi:hypothetical protein
VFHLQYPTPIDKNELTKSIVCDPFGISRFCFSTFSHSYFPRPNHLHGFNASGTKEDT